MALFMPKASDRWILSVPFPLNLTSLLEPPPPTTTTRPHSSHPTTRPLPTRNDSPQLHLPPQFEPLDSPHPFITDQQTTPRIPSQIDDASPHNPQRLSVADPYPSQSTTQRPPVPPCPTDLPTYSYPLPLTCHSTRPSSPPTLERFLWLTLLLSQPQSSV